MTLDVSASAVLTDREPVMVRRLRSADAAVVLALHGRMSERDRYLRFFGLGTTVRAKFAARIAAGFGTSGAGVGCFRRGVLIGVAQCEVVGDASPMFVRPDS